MPNVHKPWILSVTLAMAGWLFRRRELIPPHEK